MYIQDICKVKVKKLNKLQTGICLLFLFEYLNKKPNEKVQEKNEFPLLSILCFSIHSNSLKSVLN